MPFSPLSGKDGSVLVGAAPYCFGKWSLRMRSELPDVSTFCGGGYEDNVAGLTGAELSLEGPYDSGNMPLVVGTSYAFILGYGGAVTIAVTARVSDITPTVDVKDAVRVSVTAKSRTAFTAALA